MLVREAGTRPAGQIPGSVQSFYSQLWLGATRGSPGQMSVPPPHTAAAGLVAALADLQRLQATSLPLHLPFRHHRQGFLDAKVVAYSPNTLFQNFLPAPFDRCVI